MTEAEAHDLAAAFLALDVEATVRSWDYAPTRPDGTYTGEVLTRYSVHAVIRDARHGNTVVRDLTEPGDAVAVVAAMRREIKDRANGTRARIRAERAAGRS